jgi:hypothetical protein
LLVFIFFYACLSFWVRGDFGMTWDESDVYVRGWRLQKAIATGHPGLLVEKHEDPDGNLVYNHTYGLLQSLLNPSMDIDGYHAVNLATAALGYAAAYSLAFRATGNPYAALLGPAALLLNPRFFGDSPQNPKDMPYAVFYLVFLALLVSTTRRTFWPKVVALGFLLFLALSQRMAGFSLIPLWALWSLKLAPEEERLSVGRWTVGACAAVGLGLAGLFATWPYLRLSPIKHFIEILSLSADYPYNGDVLFLGKIVPVHDLPWTYPWVWLGIGVPLGILVLAVASFYWNRPWRNHPVFALLAAAVLMNFAVILSVRPSVYDGLRHLLFILPLLSVLSALGAWALLKRLPAGLPRRLFAYVLGGYAAFLAVQMASLHPYEYVYFNETVGGLKGAAGRFETDYWGASYREAAGWLRKNGFSDPKRSVVVHTRGQALQSLAFLSDRPVRWDTLDKADYFISFTRWNEHLLAGDRNPVHVVERDGVPLCYVFKMR